MPSRSVFVIICFAYFIVSFCGAQDNYADHAWDYTGKRGPSHWGALEPDFAPCTTGRHQSPIDIRNPQKADLPVIHFSYKPTSLDIINNGHTVMINQAPGSFIVVGENKYFLKQCHFHKCSEKEINGKSFDMTLHLVHADNKDNVAVVAVLLRHGEDNPLVREAWNCLPKEENEEKVPLNVSDISQILPEDRGYYTYSGSLTTPPCSEGVTWFVLRHPMTVSGAEIRRFSKLYENNARPSQPSYHRVVLETQ